MEIDQKENTDMNCEHNNISIVQVFDGEKKSVYTKEVLKTLPEWFGNEESLNDYVVEAAELPFWAAFDEKKQCIGFFAVQIHYGHTGDIVVCGVRPEYHHNGIGKSLYSATEAYFATMGCNLYRC